MIIDWAYTALCFKIMYAAYYWISFWIIALLFLRSNNFVRLSIFPLLSRTMLTVVFIFPKLFHIVLILCPGLQSLLFIYLFLFRRHWVPDSGDYSNQFWSGRESLLSADFLSFGFVEQKKARDGCFWFAGATIIAIFIWALAREAGFLPTILKLVRLCRLFDGCTDLGGFVCGLILFEQNIELSEDILFKWKLLIYRLLLFNF